MRVAVMALQGAFIEHEQVLKRLGVETFEVRQLADWQQHKDALILPGGESTVQMRLLSQLGLTCAGMILLSEGRLATMDIRVRRNAYGRQLGSFHTEGQVVGLGDHIPMTFIRAPYIEEILSSRSEILAEVNGHIVAARQGNQLVTSFHPELDPDLRLHRYFLQMVA